MNNRKPTYLKEFEQSVHSYLTREVSRGKSYMDEYFICGKCEGFGELYYNKTGDPTKCDLCDSTGKIRLQFTIEKIS